MNKQLEKILREYLDRLGSSLSHDDLVYLTYDLESDLVDFRREVHRLEDENEEEIPDSLDRNYQAQYAYACGYHD